MYVANMDMITRHTGNCRLTNSHQSQPAVITETFLTQWYRGSSHQCFVIFPSAKRTVGEVGLQYRLYTYIALVHSAQSWYQQQAYHEKRHGVTQNVTDGAGTCNFRVCLSNAFWQIQKFYSLANLGARIVAMRLIGQRHWWVKNS